MSTIAVLGATGRQGGSIVRQLVQSDGEVDVRALTRNPDSAVARALSDCVADVRYADMDDESTLRNAFEGVDYVFSVQDYWADLVGFDGEIRQAQNVIAAARAAGVRHLIQSTMATAEDVEGVPHFTSKRHVESLVHESGLEHTFLGTVFFLENTLDPRMGGSMLFPSLAGTLLEQTRIHLMSCADIGPAVASILDEPAAYVGQRIDIAGDCLTVAEMKAAYQDVTGRRPKRYRIPRFALRWLAREFAEQLEWHNRVNFEVSVAEVRESLPRTTSFRNFLKAHPEVRL